jgi:hypothetical protein
MTIVIKICDDLERSGDVLAARKKRGINNKNGGHELSLLELFTSTMDNKING